METVKQMDSALQRRTKLRSTNTVAGAAGGPTAAVMTDSEKISLQILLDVQSFGEEMKALGIDITMSPSYSGLLEETADAKSFLK